MKNTRTTLIAVAAAGLLALSACTAEPGEDDPDNGGDTGSEDGGGEDDGADDGGEASGDGVRIGIKYDQPGLGYQDGGDYTGFDVDVARYVADKLGYSEDDITWVEAPSANRETMLENGQVDMIFATYSITEERDEVVDFAGPYFVAGQDLLVREDEDRIEGPESLDGLNLCSVSGSTSAQRIQDEYADQVELIEQPGYAECLVYLQGGQVDAVTTDDIILAGLAADEGSGAFRVVGNPFSEENYGIGIPEGSDQCEAINEAVQEMIDDGSWEEFVTSNTDGTGYTANDSLNPPTLVDCG